VAVVSSVVVAAVVVVVAVVVGLGSEVRSTGSGVVGGPARREERW
jgi:hypothetical protein